MYFCFFVIFGYWGEGVFFVRLFFVCFKLLVNIVDKLGFKVFLNSK